MLEQTSRSVLPNHSLYFHRKKKEQTIWKQILAVVSYSEVESYRDIGSILCISHCHYCFSYLLRFFFVNIQCSYIA